MNENVANQLKRLDINGDGKVDLQDAKELLERELAKHKPVAIAGASFIGGLVVGFIAGRASK